MTTDLTRKRFLQGSAAVGGGIAMGGPLAALTARSAHGQAPQQDPGYGPLTPTPEEDTGLAFLGLPPGFRYRLISRQGLPSVGFVEDERGRTRPTTAPTPGVFDGMAAFPARGRGRGRARGWTVLIRNHEHRERPGEIPFVIPDDKRYDPDPATGNAGNTKLLVGPDRRLHETIQVLAGTSTNCAGGPTPWGSWIACEEVFKAGGPYGHGYNFEVDASRDTPEEARPIRRAGRFVHEAVAFHQNVLYETEDRGQPSQAPSPAPPGAPSPLPSGYGGGGFYRYIPERWITGSGQLADSDGVLQMLGVRDQPNRDMDTVNPGETLPVSWHIIDEPEPSSNGPGVTPQTTGVAFQGQNKGAASFNRPEGCWEAGGKIYFSCTSGGEARLGQLWEYDPRGTMPGESDDENWRLGPFRAGTITLVYESTDRAQLEGPDNVVVVPLTGDVFLQEDSSDPQYVRGVTPDGAIYDFAHSIINGSEFCGGCFSPDGETFFLNQQGGRNIDESDPDALNAEGGLTYAIWGPFDARSRRRRGRRD